jgi:hypothetical protein
MEGSDVTGLGLVSDDTYCIDHPRENEEPHEGQTYPWIPIAKFEGS